MPSNYAGDNIADKYYFKYIFLEQRWLIIYGSSDNFSLVKQAQTASPTFTHVYAALAAIVNTKFPNIGELMLKRLILNFKRGFKRNDKTRCMASTRFIAHLVNQQVSKPTGCQCGRIHNISFLHL